MPTQIFAEGEFQVLDASDSGTIPPREIRGNHSPVEYESTPVFVRGDGLAPIWWRGRQWAVTSVGIECLDGTYFIAANRIGEELGAGYSWPQHMGEKIWVDCDDFITAWLVGMAMHGVAAKPADIKRGIAKSHPARATSKWKSISLAPRDGTQIIGAYLRPPSIDPATKKVIPPSWRQSVYYFRDSRWAGGRGQSPQPTHFAKCPEISPLMIAEQARLKEASIQRLK